MIFSEFFSIIIIESERKEKQIVLTTNEVVDEMKSCIADIGSKAMTGRTIEERVNEMLAKARNERKER